MGKMAKVAVLFDEREAQGRWSAGSNAFERNIGEILSKAGVPHSWVADAARLEAERPDIVLAALAGADQATAAALHAFMERGGTVIAYGGLDNLAERLGFAVSRSGGAHYVELPSQEEDGEVRPLRCFNASLWAESRHAEVAAGAAADRLSAGSLGGADGELRAGWPDGSAIGPVLQRVSIGAGRLERWAIDIPSTIVALQQGTRPVTEDGIPAPDGTANLNEGILKADDGFELDWEWDRAKTERGTPYFQHPYADYWREALVGHLVQTAAGLGLSLPFVDYWPENVSRVALISFDSDGNLDEAAHTTLNVLKECGVRATWCMLEPGFSPEVYDRARADGHELGFHYNAVEHDKGIWGRDEFNRQFSWAKKATNQEKIVSNKNHYTTFRGWNELFDWCEENGIEADQTRGPSKKGNVGFPFGTCHPYFPIAWHDQSNRAFNVLEIGFLTQDLDVANFGDRTAVEPFLKQIKKVNGLAHFLFHQIHILRQDIVRDAFYELMGKLRAAGFEFWTCAEINAWERARRRVQIAALGEDGKPELPNDPGHKGIVVWVPLVDGEREDELAGSSGTATRYGQRCRKWVVS